MTYEFSIKPQTNGCLILVIKKRRPNKSRLESNVKRIHGYKNISAAEADQPRYQAHMLPGRYKRLHNTFEPNLSIPDYLEVAQPAKRSHNSAEEKEQSSDTYRTTFDSAGAPPPQIAEKWKAKGQALKIKIRNYASRYNIYAQGMHIQTANQLLIA